MNEEQVRDAEYKGLVCRGVEEAGYYYIGQAAPGFCGRLVSLFVTGPNPLDAAHTAAEHVAWVNDPLHSYVDDGTGGLCVWAHPTPGSAEDILALPGLAGMEVTHRGGGAVRDCLWDQVLRSCVEQGRAFLWGFAADDTHSRSRIGLSWYAALLETDDEFGLKAALRSGAFYVSNGPAIEEIAVQGGTVRLASEFEADVLWLRDGQYVTEDAATRVSGEPGQDLCLRMDRGVRESSFTPAEVQADSGPIAFVRAVVRTTADSLARTQPLRVREDGSLDSPYPAAGTWVRGQTHNHTDTPPQDRTGLSEFRLAYQAVGQRGSFSTDYSYWEAPHQWAPSDGTPRIESVLPDRCARGVETEAVICGVNLAPGAFSHPLTAGSVVRR